MASSSSSSPFLDLPPELVHAVLDQLHESEILVVRQTCTTLANLGADHMLSTVCTVYKRDRLERLGEIADHPRLATFVKSLYFQADRLREPALPYETWNQERKDAIPWNEYNIKHEITGFNLDTDRGMRAFHRARKRFDRIMKGNHSKAELRKAYETYVAVVKDQSVISQTKLDLSCLTKFLMRCRNLEEVTIALCHGVTGSVNAARMAFKDTMMHAYGDRTIIGQGVDQFWTFIEALRNSRRHIKYFTATELSHQILRPLWRGMPEQPDIAHLMNGLKEFRLSFSCHYDEIDPTEIDVEGEIAAYHGTGLLAQWLSMAHEIRVIKIMSFSVDIDRPTSKAVDAFGRTTWPKLRELGVSQFTTTEDYLVDLLLRHAGSLRRLSLSYICLSEGTWASVLTRIGGKLPKLKKIKLRGGFRCQEMSFDLGDTEDPGGMYGFRDGLETYALYGGDPIELSDLMEREMDDPVDFNEQAEYARLVEEGVRTGPSRMDDDDAGYTTDGSAISYGSDGFDEGM